MTSVAPAPPPRKHKKHSPGNDVMGSAEKYGYSGLGVSGRRLVESESNDYSFMQLLNEVPDSTVGLDVAIAGDLEFDRLLRIEGKFEGTLVTKVLIRMDLLKQNMISIIVILCIINVEWKLNCWC